MGRAYADHPLPRQALPSIHPFGAFSTLRFPRWLGGAAMIVGLAIAMFIALFAFGANYFGWDDPNGKVQWALFATFVLGILAGYKVKD
jgi:hypothetical protein